MPSPAQAVIRDCKDHLDANDLRGTQIETYLAGFLLVFVHSHLESEIQSLCRNRCDRAEDSSLRRLAFNALWENKQGLYVKHLKEVLDKCGAGAGRRLEADDSSPEQSAWNNIVNRRDEFVSEPKLPQLTVAEIAEFYDNARKILSDFEAALSASIPLRELIDAGEGDSLEFKETIAAINEEDPRITQIPEPQRQQEIIKTRKSVTHSALKSICAFLNTNGGTLLIGVADDGTILGLDRDLTLLRLENLDKLELHIRSLLKEKFEPVPLETVRITFLESEGLVVTRIEAQRSPEVVHLDGDIYVRFGNGSRKLEGRERTDWITARKSG